MRELRPYETAKKAARVADNNRIEYRAHVTGTLIQVRVRSMFYVVPFLVGLCLFATWLLAVAGSLWNCESSRREKLLQPATIQSLGRLCGVAA